MKLCKKFILTITILIIILSFPGLRSLSASDNSQGYISLDFSNTDSLPSNFRTSLDLSKIENLDLDLSGLNALNIVGSAEFTELSLPRAIKSLYTADPIYIVDLRQESHGFINGDAVSLFAPGNKINAGLPLNTVVKRENLFLNSIPLNRSIYLDIDKKEIVPKTVYSEETFVTNSYLNYFRIPVTDNERPTDEMIDKFLGFVKSLPKNRFIYFHCKDGIGRTSTFMILYDIINNYKDVSFDNIFTRQISLASLNSEEFKKNEERYKLLQNFYKYANDTGFDTSWQEWIKSNDIEPFTLLNEKK